jgi:hypothetical protein
MTIQVAESPSGFDAAVSNSQILWTFWDLTAGWINTPFLPPGTPASMISEASRKSKAGKSNRKEKEREVIVVDIQMALARTVIRDYV